MRDVVIAQKSPFRFDVEAGKKYAWCACGRSAVQPFCDGSHKSTAMHPMVFTAEKTETIWLCGGKHTQQQPFCDGSHKQL